MRLRLTPDRTAWPPYDLAQHRATVALGRAAYRAHLAGQPYAYFPEDIRPTDWFREGWLQEQDAHQQQRWADERKAYEDRLIDRGQDYAIIPAEAEDPGAWKNPRWV